MNYQEVLSFARDMRKNPTKAESYFWGVVRNRNFLGYKFTRQYVIKYNLTGRSQYFIVDFFCHSQKLIVEIDGGYHLYQLELDKDRDEILESYGYKILRLSNEVVLNNSDLAYSKLEAALC